MAKTQFISDTQTQNGLEYLETLNKQLRNKPRELTKYQQQQIIQVYKKAYMDTINRGIKNAYGDSKAVKNLTAAYSQQIYDELLKVVMKYNSQAAKDLADINKQMMQLLMGDGYKQIKDQVDKLVDIVNADTVEQVIRGKLYEDRKGLDKRLWSCTNTSGEKIEDAVASCMAEGMGAAEMAQNLKEFAMGGHHTWSRNKIREKLGSGYARKYSGGLDYESLRLARTTITHQAQIETINTRKVNPYMGGVKWHSNHEAGRTCDLCNSRDGHIFIVDKEDIPLDHPNGACWLEPVWMINGKEATPEEIAKDMRAWANGEKNSGAMDKIPEYKGLGGTAKPKTKTTRIKTTKDTIKKTTKTTNKAAKQKSGIYTEEERAAKYAELHETLKKQISKTNKKYTTEGILEALKQAPLDVQDMYLSIGKFQRTNSTGGAFYSPTDKKIHMSLKDERNLRINNFGEKHRYDVLFHEWGHMIDDQGTQDDFKMYRFSGGSEPMYSKITLKNAIKPTGLAQSFERDMNNWKAKWVEEKFHGTKTLENTPAPLVNGKFADFLHDNEVYTIALQDAAKGMSAGAVKTKWGHDAKYYTRNQDGNISAYESACIEVSSELWAEISSNMTQPETRKFLYENFPEMMKSYDKLVKDTLKQFKK
jgi:hypothetical protein